MTYIKRSPFVISHQLPDKPPPPYVTHRVAPPSGGSIQLEDPNRFSLPTDQRHHASYEAEAAVWFPRGASNQNEEEDADVPFYRKQSCQKWLRNTLGLVGLTLFALLFTVVILHVSTQSDNSLRNTTAIVGGLSQAIA